MTLFELVKWLHVLLFGAWLGADYGTFLSSRVLLQADKSPETRATAARMMVLFDVGPRVALVLTLPAGLSLGSWLGFIPGGLALRVGVWVGALVWLAVLLFVELREEHPLRETLRKIDFGWRIVLAATLLATSIWSLLGDDGPFKLDYLAWKALIFAVILSMGIMIRVKLRVFGEAFGAALSGSTPECEATLRSSLYRTYPFVMTIWVLVLVAGYLGIANP
ncbi:MAG: hypothetical protein ACI867_001383 [Glaciecola sp.]